MKTSESIKQLSTSLALAHKKIKHATKDANNPHFRNDYATLESVIDATKDALLEVGIIVMQSMSEDGNTLTTRLQHISGEFVETYCKILLTKNDMQGLGSAITYARRYSLSAVCNMTQADDDGNGASGKETKPPVKRAPTKVASTVTVQNEDF